MSAKQIGGYCEKRTALILILENLDKDSQHPMTRRERDCLYSCCGYNYECPDYEGSKINLKGGGEWVRYGFIYLQYMVEFIFLYH